MLVSYAQAALVMGLAFTLLMSAVIIILPNTWDTSPTLRWMWSIALALFGAAMTFVVYAAGSGWWWVGALLVAAFLVRQSVLYRQER